MKRLLLLLALSPLFTGCATMARHYIAAHPEISKPAAAAANHKWPVDDVFMLSTEYAAPDQPIHAQLYGPTKKEALCNLAGAASFAQAPQYTPKGQKFDEYTSTCLEVNFTKPLGPKGAVIPQHYSGTPLEFLLVGADYNLDGSYRSAGALHAVHDMKTCKAQAHDIIDSNYKDGTTGKGVSVLIYCVPVYSLPTKTTLPNGDEVL